MKEKGLDLENIFDNWFSNGGQYLIDIGVDELNFEDRTFYSSKYNKIYHSVGIHPNSAGGNLVERMKKVQSELNKNSVVAIGETGLDYYWDTVDKSIQRDFFISHIELAIKYDLPIIIHNRDATEDMISILKKYKGKLRGIIHCFSEGKKEVEEFIDLGFYISYAGNVTYKKNHDLQESLKYVPLDHFLLETDSPYLSPTPLRGKLNTPLNIIHSYNFVSEKLNTTDFHLKELVTNNIKAIFKLEEEL